MLYRILSFSSFPLSLYKITNNSFRNMCGRASLSKVEKDLEERFRATFYTDETDRYHPLPTYNIAPTHYHPVITSDQPHLLQYFRWGLIPFWAKDPAIGSRMINARKETILEKSAFKNAAKNRRCLVPFDGFYEWKKTPEGKIPHFIGFKNKEIFSIAGLWEKWKSPEAELVYSFTLITQPPNELLASIHDRMPAILTKDQEALWINSDLPAEEALAMITPLPDEFLTTYLVSKKVNKVSNNDPSLIEEVNDNGPVQGKLF